MKRGPTPDEEAFLGLRTAASPMSAAAAVAALVRTRPEWQPGWGGLRSAGETLRATLGATTTGAASGLALATAASGRPLSGFPLLASAARRLRGVEESRLCRGGPLQGPGGRTLRQASSQASGLASGLASGEGGGDAWLSQRLGVVALSMKTPGSLAASMTSWQASGLLALVSERMAFLSEPMAAEVVSKALGMSRAQQQPTPAWSVNCCPFLSPFSLF